MKRKTIKKSVTNILEFRKTLTGIQGLDDILMGGIPENRPTLLLGNAGCGKTILSMEFLINGIVMFNEPAVFISFEENRDELMLNVKSLGYNLDKHLADNEIYIEHIQINPADFRETGKYDLEGLFVRLGQAIDKVKAKRVVLDSLDTLFYGFDNTILR